MQTIQSITLGQVKGALHSRGVFSGNADWEIRYRSAIAAPVIDGVRVVDCPLTDDNLVYDWTQTADELRDGDVFLFANGTRAGVLVEAWPVFVVGERGELAGLADGYAWETLDGGKYAAAAAVARKLVPQLA